MSKTNQNPDVIEIGEAKPGCASVNGSVATGSVRTQLAEMMAALDAGDSEKYWAAFEAVMKRHEELLDEVCRPQNAQAQARPNNQG